MKDLSSNYLHDCNGKWSVIQQNNPGQKFPGQESQKPRLSHPSITVSFQSTPLHPAVPTDLINRLIIPGTVNYSYDETADTGPNYRVHTHTGTVYFTTGNIQGRDRDARVVTADRRYGKDERAASVEARTAVIRALHTATPPLICITPADAASTWIFTGHL